EALAGDDAVAAYEAAWALTTARAKAVGFLKDRLQPAPADDPQLRRLLTELGAETFTVREKAFEELRKFGAAAWPAPGEALRTTTAVEVRQRLTTLFAAPEIRLFPDPIRRSRAVQILERIGSAEARLVLESLAKNSPSVLDVQEAAAALERLSK